MAGMGRHRVARPTPLRVLPRVFCRAVGRGRSAAVACRIWAGPGFVPGEAAATATAAAPLQPSAAHT